MEQTTGDWKETIGLGSEDTLNPYAIRNENELKANVDLLGKNSFMPWNPYVSAALTVMMVQ